MLSLAQAQCNHDAKIVIPYMSSDPFEVLHAERGVITSGRLSTSQKYTVSLSVLQHIVCTYHQVQSDRGFWHKKHLRHYLAPVAASTLLTQAAQASSSMLALAEERSPSRATLI